MLKWILLLVVVGGAGYGAYEYYQGGFHTRPKMPDGAFSVSYKNGLRGILVDVPDEQRSRRYLGVPMKVPFYLEDAWSWCHPPTQDELIQAEHFMSKRDWPGQRLDAVCKITVEGEEVVRGLILTVPKVD